MERFDRFYTLNIIFKNRKHPVPLNQIMEEMECAKATTKRIIGNMRLWHDSIKNIITKNVGLHKARCRQNSTNAGNNKTLSRPTKKGTGSQNEPPPVHNRQTQAGVKMKDKAYEILGRTIIGIRPTNGNWLDARAQLQTYMREGYFDAYRVEIDLDSAKVGFGLHDRG